MDTRQALKTLRLLFGAAQAEADKSTIAEEYIPQIQCARADIKLLRGVDVFEALLVARRSGINLAIDVTSRVRIIDGHGEGEGDNPRRFGIGR